jgi:hypothetical protein
MAPRASWPGHRAEPRARSTTDPASVVMLVEGPQGATPLSQRDDLASCISARRVGRHRPSRTTTYITLYPMFFTCAG